MPSVPQLSNVAASSNSSRSLAGSLSAREHYKPDSLSRSNSLKEAIREPLTARTGGTYARVQSAQQQQHQQAQQQQQQQRRWV